MPWRSILITGKHPVIIDFSIYMIIYIGLWKFENR